MRLFHLKDEYGNTRTSLRIIAVAAFSLSVRMEAPGWIVPNIFRTARERFERRAHKAVTG